MDRKPNITAYFEYREYLQAWLDYQRRVNPGYTFASFAAASGLSRSALPNILNGTRNPLPETLDGIAQALELTPLERNYLGLLVELERAPTVSDRRRVLERIVDRAAFGRSGWIEERGDAYLQFASHWYYPAVMELARQPSFRADPAWVAKAVMPPISVQEAQQALDTLTELGLIVLTKDGGAKVPLIRLQTQPDSEARATLLFHKEAVPAVLNQIEETPPDERHLAGGVFSLPNSVLPEAKALVQGLIQQLGTLADDESDTSRRAYLVAVQLMPISRPFE